MGRFRYLDDDEDDDGNDHWEFIAEPENEGAIVTSNTSSSFQDCTMPTTLRERQSEQPRAMYFFVQNSNDSSRPKRRLPYWFWIAFLAVLIQVISFFGSRFGPPAPPPSAQQGDTWQDYFTTHVSDFFRSTKALFYETPIHIGMWWMVHIKSDLQILFDRYTQPQACPLQVDIHTDVFSLLSDSIVGQSNAVQVVSEAVQTWHADSAPMLIYLVGVEGVGKQTLALTLARDHFLNHCSYSEQTRAILTLSGSDFSVKGAGRTEEFVRALLAQRIIRHVQRLDGAIIILRDIEHMEPSVFRWLVQELKQKHASASETSSSTWQLGEHCRKVAFFFTSTLVGRTAIHKSIRVHGGISNINRPSLVLDMGHEIDSSFGQGTFQAFDAVAPFFPLTQQDLSNILQQQIAVFSQDGADKIWRHFSLTQAAVDALLDHTQVEYLTWHKRDGSETSPLLTFSSVGARVLEQGSPIHNKIEAQVNRCIVPNPMPRLDAVMDYDPWSKQGFLQMCNSDGDCEGSCRFAI